MTPNQRTQLETLAKVVVSDYTDVSESFAVGRVCLVTGRTWDAALKGVRMMADENILPPGWINTATVGIIERLTQNQAIRNLFDRFDVVPLKTEVLKYCGFCLPKRISPEELAKAFTLPQF